MTILEHLEEIARDELRQLLSRFRSEAGAALSELSARGALYSSFTINRLQLLGEAEVCLISERLQQIAAQVLSVPAADSERVSQQVIPTVLGLYDQATEELAEAALEMLPKRLCTPPHQLSLEDQTASVRGRLSAELSLLVDRPATRETVLLIHGIRTQAEWAQRVIAALDEVPSVTVVPTRYGFFDIIRFLLPFETLRRAPVRRVTRLIRDEISRGPVRLSVIAHSFGTYIVAKVLEGEPDIDFYRLVLCGSIIPESFEWSRYKHRLRQDSDRWQVINDCGTMDIWPVLASSVTWGYGASGRFGFGDGRVKDRFFNLDHGGFFERAFIEDYWLPFFSHDLVRDGLTDRTKAPWLLSAITVLKIRHVLLSVALLIATLLGLLLWSAGAWWAGEQVGMNDPETIGMTDEADPGLDEASAGREGSGAEAAQTGENSIVASPDPETSGEEEPERRLVDESAERQASDSDEPKAPNNPTVASPVIHASADMSLVLPSRLTELEGQPLNDGVRFELFELLRRYKESKEKEYNYTITELMKIEREMGSEDEVVPADVQRLQGVRVGLSRRWGQIFLGINSTSEAAVDSETVREFYRTLEDMNFYRDVAEATLFAGWEEMDDSGKRRALGDFLSYFDGR